MKSLSDLVNDSEDYSGEPVGEPAKAISISVTEPGQKLHMFETVLSLGLFGVVHTTWFSSS